MKIHNFIQNLLIVFVLVLIVYCIIDGIKNSTYLGTSLALGSLVALVFCIRLLKRLRETAEE